MQLQNLTAYFLLTLKKCSYKIFDTQNPWYEVKNVQIVIVLNQY